MTTAAIPTANNPGPIIVAMRELISAISSGLDSPEYKLRLEEAEKALNVPSKLLIILSESWGNLIAEQIAQNTGIDTRNFELGFMGTLKNLNLDEDTAMHLSVEYKVNMSNEQIARAWLNLKAFEELAHRLDNNPSALPFSMIRFLNTFKKDLQPEYQAAFDRLLDHLKAYFVYLVEITTIAGNIIVQSENERNAKKGKKAKKVKQRK